MSGGERPYGASEVAVRTVFKTTTTGRVRADVPEPARDRLASAFDAKGLPDVRAIQDHFVREGRLTKADALRLVAMAQGILKEEPNMLEVSPPMTIAGDLHGQYYDLLQLFKVAGDPSTVNYTFLGDYCDRGQFGCETILLLYAWKVLRPKNFWLLRGNHECRHLTDYFNFKQEAVYKYGIEFYEAITDSWDYLPIAALLNKKFLLVHGGLSPEIKTLQDINLVDRVQEPPAFGLMCDLLWADPVPDYNETDGNRGAWTYRDNSNRGCSYHFSFRAVLEFLHSNDLFSVIRGHEVMYPGFQMYKADPKNQFPSLITLFSAPNYCDDHGNKGAILEYGLGNVMNIKQFSAVEHPYNLPNFGNVLSWSLPFVAEKCADFITALHKMELEEEEDELEQQEHTEQEKHNAAALAEIARRREVIKNKVLAMGKMQMMFATLRKEKENIVKLKGLTGNNLLPKGVLLQGPNAIQASVEFFERSKAEHAAEEMMPVKAYESELRKSDSQQAKKALFQLKKSHEDLSKFVKK